jgi:hypothetical protein
MIVSPRSLRVRGSWIEKSYVVNAGRLIRFQSAPSNRRNEALESLERFARLIEEKQGEARSEELGHHQCPLQVLT